MTSHWTPGQLDIWDAHGEFYTACGFNQGRMYSPPSQESLKLAESLIVEECVNELLPALRKYTASPSLENAAEVLDGAVDTVYVIFHLCRTMGLPFEKGFAEVHRSNMTKVVDGKVLRREDGKIMKPPGYTPPNLINLIFDAYDLHAHQDLVLGSDNYRNKNC